MEQLTTKDSIVLHKKIAAYYLITIENNQKQDKYVI